ncbi:hypothetical protein BG006_008835 [Podila minutissima]|uniref:Cryptic loci regulator 2 N-terminal domain-containing protein n=1 Tax=Podila minutissima TaxID=64525 RepID=A0A9P5SHQ7_9FUNG|nr:hypothetical protein BG006_008835 [Podila minutissima]
MRMHHPNQFGTGNYVGRPVTASNKNPHINLRDPVLPSQTALDSELFTAGGMTRPQPAAFPYAPLVINYRPTSLDEPELEPKPEPSSKNGTSTNTSRSTTSSHGNSGTNTRKSNVSSPVRHSRSVYKKQPYPKFTKKTSTSLPNFCKLPSFRKASSTTIGIGSSSTIGIDSSSSMSRPDRISMTMSGPSLSSSSSSSLKVLPPTNESSVSRPKSIGRINMMPFRPVANRRAPIPLNLDSKDKVSSHGQSLSASNLFVGDTKMDMATSSEQGLQPVSSKAIMHGSPKPMEDVHQPVSKRPLPLDQVSCHHVISMTPTPLSSSPSLVVTSSTLSPPLSPISPNSSISPISPISPTAFPPQRVATPVDFRTSFNTLSVNHKSVHDTQTSAMGLPSKNRRTEAHALSKAPTMPPTTPSFCSSTSPVAMEKVHYVDDQFEYDECLITKVVSPTGGIVYYNLDVDTDNRAAHKDKAKAKDKVKDKVKDEIKQEEQHGSKKTLKITQFFHSDGSRSRFPQHSNVRELRMDDKLVQEWLLQAMLTSLPPGYSLFEECRTRKCLLFGHVEGAFKYPEQFIPHALWLSSADYASLECVCRVCLKGPQVQPKQDESLLPFQVNVDKGTGTVSYDMSHCTYSKDSMFCDIPPKIKQDQQDVSMYTQQDISMYTQQDHIRSMMMDMDMEDSKVDMMEGDCCEQGHSAQLLLSPAEDCEQEATNTASHTSQSDHAKRAGHAWSPHVLGPFFPVQPKKHKVQSLREIRVAQGHSHK